MTAVIRKVTELGSIHTSGMAVRDNDPHWSEIHRALSWTFLDSGRTHYVVACGNDFNSSERRPVELSSGEVAGPLCPGCFGHLIRSAA